MERSTVYKQGGGGGNKHKIYSRLLKLSERLHERSS